MGHNHPTANTNYCLIAFGKNVSQQVNWLSSDSTEQRHCPQRQFGLGRTFEKPFNQSLEGSRPRLQSPVTGVMANLSAVNTLRAWQ